MNPKTMPLFPPTWRQSVFACIFSSIFFFASALMVSPVNILHPLWVLAIYLCVFCAIRAITEDFASVKNPEFMYGMVFGFLQLLSGSFILTSIIVSGISALWIGMSLVFWYLGARNIARATHIWQVEAYEQAQVERVMSRQREFAAQDALRALEQQERAAEDQKNEEALVADLADFLAGSDRK